MPSSLLFFLPTSLMVAYAINWYICFRRNIKRAKDSGIPYVVVPVYVFSRFWLVTHQIWLKLGYKFLPKNWAACLDHLHPEVTWIRRYETFQRLGTDTYLRVSGGDLSMRVADADVISQITTRRNDFPKPIYQYVALDIYGKNVVTTEGAAWRRHRKLTSPSFSEKNNQLVWAETLVQTRAMLDGWLGPDRKGNRTVDRIMDDTMRLSLHVINRAGFGRKLEWPSDEEASVQRSRDYHDPTKIQNLEAEIEKGHTMSYTYALHYILDHLLYLILLNPWFIRLSPLKGMRRTYQAYVEFGRYLREMAVSKKMAIQSGRGLDEMDIMGQLVKDQVSGQDGKPSSREATLSDSEIIGNAFVVIIAGHESTANSIHFAILLLALNVGSQRRLQKELEDHFQGRPISEWDYDRDLPALFGGMVGAVMNEQLRLVPAVHSPPKCTYGVGPQPLNVNGKRCTVPANTHISLCAVSVHSNPKYWPHGPPTDPKKPAHPISNRDNDLEEFKPERWLLGDNGNGKVDGKVDGNATGPSDRQEAKTAESEDLNISAAATTAASLYHPPKGAYIPFSEGFRACVGRRFAQVEIMAALAVIFSQYSAELAVDKYATDEEIENMDQEERGRVWGKAADEARRLIWGCTSILTLQMRQGHVPIRFVKKGEERFQVPT